MDLSNRYQQELENRGFGTDRVQEQAIGILSSLSEELSLYQQKKLKRMSFFKKPKAPDGVYFWGGVGRGKTFIMDLFYDEVEVGHKKRIHFHRFMQMIHDKLKEHTQIANPLDAVVKEFSKDCQLLCLDEFFVSDIADAMILHNLLDAFYCEGVVIVTTSNIDPDGLYNNGLQRARFLPAIEGIKNHFKVFNLDGGEDYRLQTLTSSPLYFTPADHVAELEVKSMFFKLVPDLVEMEPDNCIEINNRKIDCISACEDVLWISFEHLCGGARSVSDYIEISKLYHAVLISGVPCLGAHNDDAARRFVNMVDEFYDRGVKMVVSSDVEIPAIYSGARLSFEFERTVSRLLEMQSESYLAKPHLPE